MDGGLLGIDGGTVNWMRNVPPEGIQISKGRVKFYVKTGHNSEKISLSLIYSQPTRRLRLWIN